MSKPIPIVADVPRDDPGLGFPEYVSALSDAVRGGVPPQFTIGVYGAWGSGKSSLLNAISKNLSQDRDVIPVLFDAWRYERSGYIVVPLLHSIHRTATELGEKTVATYLKRALTSVLYSVNFHLGIVEIDPSRSLEAQEDNRLVPLDDAFSKPFSDLQRIPEALKGRRIAILIDDLDRCSPENVVAVLESINLVMDIPGFIFVLALDYDVLVRAVSQKYPHASAHVFIEKMVQVPFRVPRLSLSPQSFLDDLIPDWMGLQASLPSDFMDYCHDICQLGLDANPRQIKRMINSLLVLKHVAEQRNLDIDYARLAALIGFQLRWPEHYLAFSKAVFTGQDRPQDKLLYVREEPQLEEYGKRFFANIHSPVELQLLLQLTASVIAPKSTEQPVPEPTIPDPSTKTTRGSPTGTSWPTAAAGSGRLTPKPRHLRDGPTSEQPAKPLKLPELPGEHDTTTRPLKLPDLSGDPYATRNDAAERSALERARKRLERLVGGGSAPPENATMIDENDTSAKEE